MTGDYKEQRQAIIDAQMELAAIRKTKRKLPHRATRAFPGLVSALETIDRVEQTINPVIEATYKSAHRNRELCTCCDSIVKVLEDSGLVKPVT